MWTPRPDELIVLTDAGSGDMGDVTDEHSRARFSLERARSTGVLPDDVSERDTAVIVSVRGSFIGDTGATGKADCVAKVDSPLGGDFDKTLWTFPDRGVTVVGAQSTIHFRVPADELFVYYLAGARFDPKGDELVFEWTNPDTGKIRWTLEVAIAVQRATNVDNR